ncbi:hypothetical protein M0Q50_09000 [bacterium]|jgi:hypothetical protein|nr:hypothetical protein [bacterium]
MPIKNTSTEIGNFKLSGFSLKDIIYIISLLITLTGWIRSETIQKQKFENQIEILTKKIDANQEQLQKINEIFLEQQVLNGKIIQYMQMK